MYEQFTDRARKVWRLANQEAHRFNHRFIGPEHVLLGLVKEGSGVGVHALKNLGVNPPILRSEIEKRVSIRPDSPAPGQLPQTPRAKKVVEYAIEEARQLNHNYVGTEHVLLGLLRVGDGVAARVLRDRGIKLEEVRQGVVNLIGPHENGPGPLCQRNYARCVSAWLHKRSLTSIFIIGLILTLGGGLAATLWLGTDYTNGGALVCGLVFVSVLLLTKLKILIATRMRQTSNHARQDSP